MYRSPTGSTESITVTSNPYRVRASDRGMGVALITRREGASIGSQPWPLFDPEPVLFISDDKAEIAPPDIRSKQA